MFLLVTERRAGLGAVWYDQAVILYHPQHHWHMVLVGIAVVPNQRYAVSSCSLQRPTVSIGSVEPILCGPPSRPPFLQDVFAGLGAEERQQCHSWV